MIEEVLSSGYFILHIFLKLSTLKMQKGFTLSWIHLDTFRNGHSVLIKTVIFINCLEFALRQERAKGVKNKTGRNISLFTVLTCCKSTFPTVTGIPQDLDRGSSSASFSKCESSESY